MKNPLQLVENGTKVYPVCEAWSGEWEYDGENFDKTSAKRLLWLADYLEEWEFPDHSFVMNDWGKYHDIPERKSDENPCGFAGCALGWAATDGVFKGLKLTRCVGDEWLSFINDIYDTPNEQPLVIQYKGYDGLEAAQALFGLTDWEASELFTEHTDNKTPKQVAKRIRKFVAKKQKRNK